MVKLGSLYRGPQDAPLSHRIRNIPTTPSISSNNTNFNAISYNNGPHQSSTREQLSKYQKNEIQVSNLWYVLRFYDKQYAQSYEN